MATAMQIGNDEGTSPSVEVEPADPAERTVRAHVAQLLEAAERVQASADPDAIHRLRTSARKLRASLKVFGAAFPKQLAARARKAVKQVARALDDARVWDGHRELLQQLYGASSRQDEKAAIEYLLETVDDRRADCRKELLRDLGRVDIAKLGTLLDRLASKSKYGKHDKRRTKDTRKVVTRLVEAGLGGLEGVQTLEAVEDLQRVRMPLRRLRHTLEVLELGAASPVGALEQALGDLVARTRTLKLVDESRAKLAEAGRTVLNEGANRVSGRIGDEQRELRERLSGLQQQLDRELLTKQLDDALSTGKAAHDDSDESDEDDD
jgi:CHAD domain-containing protein